MVSRPLDRGNKDALWPRKAKPVIVAVVDSGIDFGHPDLYGTAWVNLGETPNNGKDDDENGLVDDFYGWNYIDDNNNVRDLNGHGTFVAGIIAAATDAVTYAAQLVKNETLPATDTFGREYRGLQVYGYKVVKPQGLVHLYAYKG